MREFNLLGEYPQPDRPRIGSRNLRTIHHRLVAFDRSEEFFDGDRNFGYGGYTYDGRWQPIAKSICQSYGLKAGDKVLQINSEKGFLLHDLKSACAGLEVFGSETSEYAIEKSMDDVKNCIHRASPDALPFPNGHFDFIIGMGVVYTQTLEGAVQVLKEIQRKGKGASFVTLAAYETEEDYFLFRDWTLLGALILKKEEWREILEYSSYTGDYWFTGAGSLSLIREDG